ncbi:helix-turn-helix domain-containing protein [Rhizobium sp. CFBP 8752]|uniref:helix-turn-helix domain-containing protein n=1 Tax=Rhizobium sp. CFBP 8752 TaxID=2775301 RepID=UPI001781178F|nr:helix-turn-helix domain-containing protein [Rhizobium sp. CFBP 8752]MBD8665280.1 helix-turn-helix domain-containing protein [Rhizobium sp. CFBP 8752]
MSIMIMSRLFRMELGGCNRKLLAVRLADFADDEGRGIYPGVPRLARETELSERTIQRILSEFVSEGILVIVQEATGRRGQATRYDFDLPRLFAFKPKATGDSVSPVATDVTGDTAAARGDTGDADGCHGVTLTVIEPLPNPKTGARDRAPAEGGIARSDRKRIEREFVLWFAIWKKGDVGFARNSWFALSDDERAECTDRTPAYLRWAKPSDIMAGAVYLKNRHWRDAPAEALAPMQHNPFSRAWMAFRLAELLKPMATAWPALTKFQRMEASKSANDAKAVEMERRQKYGWPRVTALHDMRAAIVPHGLVAVSEGFEKVHCDSGLAKRWQALHERQGWPWVPQTGHEWLYFPPLPEGIADHDEAVAAALREFQKKLIERRDDDAA